MAIEKTIEIGTSGVEAAYWRIVRVTANFEVAPSFEATLAGYLSAAARAAQRSPIEGAYRTVTLTSEHFPPGSDLTAMSMGQLYEAISASSPVFAGGVAV